MSYNEFCKKEAAETLRALGRAFQDPRFKAAVRERPTPYAGISIAGAAAGIIPFLLWAAGMIIAIAAMTALFLAWWALWMILWGIGAAIAGIRPRQSPRPKQRRQQELPRFR
jgi:hypothetical protein